MTVELNHTIVHASNRDDSARFLAGILGLEGPSSYGPFAVVNVANGVSLDFVEDSGTIHSQHYAFLVGEEDFDAIHARIMERELPYWADPLHQQPQVVNDHDGGRGVYWDDPDGHNLEIITVPYGGGS